MLQFEWDHDKSAKNFKKHNVSFKEAATVFSDPLSRTYPDPDHSFGEERYITIGMSEFGRILIISHKDLDDTIRIISSRITTSKERKFYEKK